MIDKSKLQKGDILLYHGVDHFINRAINYFDEARYSHPTIYIGDDKVIQATGKYGVHITTLTESAEGYSEILIRRLKDSPNSMQPVLDHGFKLLNRKYEYSQVLLLGLLLATRKIKRYNNLFAKLAAEVFTYLAESFYLSSNHNDNKLICSELTYRCYNDALSSHTDPYTIVLKNQSNRKQRKRNSLAEIYEEGSLMSRFYALPNKNKSINPFVETNFYENNTRLDSIVNKMNEIKAKPDLISSFDKIEKLFDEYDKDKELIMSFENEVKLKHSLDQFLLFDGGYIKHNPINGFEIPSVHKNKNTNASLDAFIKLRNQFVTAKDLKHATNLVDIGYVLK